jgi:hypothetical protein
MKSDRVINFYLTRPRIIRQVDPRWHQPATPIVHFRTISIPALFNVPIWHNEANDQFFRLVRIAAHRWRWLTAFFPGADLLIRAKRATVIRWTSRGRPKRSRSASREAISSPSGAACASFGAGPGSIAGPAGQREQPRGIIPLSIRPFDCRRRIFHTANNLPACVKRAPSVRL